MNVTARVASVQRTVSPIDRNMAAVSFLDYLSVAQRIILRSGKAGPTRNQRYAPAAKVAETTDYRFYSNLRYRPSEGGARPPRARLPWVDLRPGLKLTLWGGKAEPGEDEIAK